MFVSATLNLAAIRLRGLFPDWFNTANCFVGAGPTDATEVGRHWMCVYDGGLSSVDHHDGGSLGRRWRLMLSYSHEWQADNRERYTIEAIQVKEHMRKIVGRLHQTTGPTAMDFWMPYAVPGLSFTSGGTIELLPGRVVVQNGGAAAGIVADVQLTSGDWAAGTAAGLIYLEPLYSMAFTSGGTTQIVPNKKIELATGLASATVADVVLTGGTWAAGTAAGNLYLYGVTGTWTTGQIDMGANTNVATSSGSATVTPWAAGQIDLRVVSPIDGSTALTTNIATASGAATATQIVAEPLRVSSEPILTVVDGARSLVRIEQSYDVFSIA